MTDAISSTIADRGLDADACYRACSARDARFDGVFFVGVTTTGIYCRTVCPARTPRRDRCRFYRLAAEAERDGFRACFRCRPELAPGGAAVDAVSRLAKAALARIEAGALDDDGVAALASDLGKSDRHVRRALERELGVSPVALAQSRRLAFARQLLFDTAMPVTDVAFASGFSSVRRFNAVARARWGGAPSSLRRRPIAAAGGVALRLAYRPPLAWDALLAFLAPRAIPGVERVEGGRYVRAARVGAARGWLAVEPDAAALRVTLSESLAPAAGPIVARVRSLFDLDAHPARIDEALAQDRRLAPLVRARPGLRVPGAFDGFETAARTILGQQVSVRAATTLAGRLATAFGEPVVAVASPGAPVRVFPSAGAVADAGESRLASLGLVRARAAALARLAEAVASGRVHLAPSADPEATIASLVELPGIGPWTAHVIAMRALRWPDAFPDGDLAVRRVLGASGRAAVGLAEPWRPWRAYATLHLWTEDLS